VTRGLLAFAAVAATLAAGWVAAPRLAARAGDAAFLPRDHPTIALDRDVTEQFGFENPVVWVLEARAATVWTPPMLARIAALTDEVRRVPGVIGVDVIGLASPNMRDLRVTAEGLEPTYLMGEVPKTPEAVAALRQRIDADPNYAGTLVTRDGRAAMVVANFRDDADASAVGAAALALRDRYRDADTAVWATGAPVLAVAAPAALAAVSARAIAFAATAVAVGCAVAGMRVAAAALVAAAMAAVWLGAAVVLAGAALPWALEAVVPTALVAAAIAAGARRAVVLGAALTAGMLAAAFAAAPGSGALWLAGAAGMPLALAAGGLARGIVDPRHAPPSRRRVVRAVAGVVAAAALLGLPRTRCSLSLVGYGERYLPVAAAADVAAMRRLFPPPLSLAVRLRGEPGFVTSPEVLHALDAAAAAARADPAVRSAMSIADVIKMVHRAFNDERPEFFAIPDDGALAGRYLALAYSPVFRRFVDRAFAQTALWVQVNGERPRDLRRVLRRVRAALAERPPSGATVDPPVGDGAVLLVMAQLARRVASAAAIALVVVAGAMTAVAGWRAGATALGAGALAATVGAGVLGWAGHAIDLVSLPILAGAAVATAPLGSTMLPSSRFALGLASAGAVALAAPLPGAPLIAAVLLGAGLAVLLTTSPAASSSSAPTCPASARTP
jgi:hypothetical protein